MLLYYYYNYYIITETVKTGIDRNQKYIFLKTETDKIVTVLGVYTVFIDFVLFVVPVNTNNGIGMGGGDV